MIRGDDSKKSYAVSQERKPIAESERPVQYI